MYCVCIVSVKIRIIVTQFIKVKRGEHVVLAIAYRCLHKHKLAGLSLSAVHNALSLKR